MKASKLMLLGLVGWGAFVLGQHLSLTGLGQTRVSILPSSTGTGNGWTVSSGGDTGIGSGSGGTGSLTSTSQPDTNATGNWAGYVMSGTNITKVSGAWTVPSPSLDGGSGSDATWIGIGGDSSQDLIQTGTQNTVGRDGQTESSAFFEMLPDSETPVDSLNINPGDKMSATIAQTSPGNWTVSLKDESSGASFTRQVQYDSSLSSAEWIEEDPSLGNGQVPLDNFGSVKFTSAGAVANGRSQDITGSRALTMVNRGGQALTSVSSFDGSGFTVNRTSASSTSGIGGYMRGGGGYRHWGESGVSGPGYGRHSFWR